MYRDLIKNCFYIPGIKPITLKTSLGHYICAVEPVKGFYHTMSSLDSKSMYEISKACVIDLWGLSNATEVLNRRLYFRLYKRTKKLFVSYKSISGSIYVPLDIVSKMTAENEQLIQYIENNYSSPVDNIAGILPYDSGKLLAEILENIEEIKYIVQPWLRPYFIDSSLIYIMNDIPVHGLQLTDDSMASLYDSIYISPTFIKKYAPCPKKGGIRFVRFREDLYYHVSSFYSKDDFLSMYKSREVSTATIINNLASTAIERASIIEKLLITKGGYYEHDTTVLTN